jgi:hypothetical protein
MSIATLARIGQTRTWLRVMGGCVAQSPVQVPTLAQALRNRFWVETVLGSATTILTAITLISREWIEIVFGVDPDHGNGALEWMIIAVLAAASVAFGVLARMEWGRAQLEV